MNTNPILTIISLLALTLVVQAAKIERLTDSEAKSIYGMSSGCSCVRTIGPCLSIHIPHDCSWIPITGPLIIAGSKTCVLENNYWESFSRRNIDKYCEASSAPLSFCVDYREISSCVYYFKNKCAIEITDFYHNGVLTGIQVDCIHGSTTPNEWGYGKYNDAIGIPCAANP